MNILTHYESIYDKYERNLRCIEDCYQEEAFNDVTRLLDLKTSDLLIDLGCGSGFLASQLYSYAKLESPAWAVEPNLSMKNSIERRDGLKWFGGDLKEFCNTGVKFDKCLMKGMVHHLHPLSENLKAVYFSLKPQGRALVWVRLPQTRLPFFAAARKTFEASSKPSTYWVDEAQAVGFKCCVEIKHYPVEIEKQRWTEIVKDRFMSNLSQFSDQQIDDGIQEIKQKYPSVISCVDYTALILLKK